MKKTKHKEYFQLRDSDNEEYGIVLANISEDDIQSLWEKFYNEDFKEGDELPKEENWSQDISAEVFVDYLVQLGFDAERIFLSDINP